MHFLSIYYKFSPHTINNLFTAVISAYVSYYITPYKCCVTPSWYFMCAKQWN